ncbi:MAG: hypothetical protein LBS51_08500 [Oscillospiraceae bacterium]|nr:hypothetical protein [Oscillospiraceae bacterium]
MDDVVRNSGATTGSDDSTADLRYALDDVARKLYATHVVGKISDVSPLLLENADESGAIAYSLTYAADTALMAGWVSLYNCDLSEFVAAQFLGMSKGAENRQYKFDGLNTEHVYALFISAVADEVSSDQLSILVHVEQ